MPQKIYLDRNARQTGFGSSLYKFVVGQSKQARLLVKAGEIVVFDSGRKSGGSYGTTFRQIVLDGSRWRPRVPSQDVLNAVERGEFSEIE